MNFTLVRIDDRLIHGQVALGWTRAKGIDVILAVDNEVSKDSFQCSLLKMATPSGVKSYIIDEKKAIEVMQSGKLGNKKIMLLVRGPQTILNLLDNGFEISEINVGNLRSEPGREKLLGYVYASADDIKLWKELAEKDLKIYAQSVPDSQAVDFKELISKIK